MKKLLMEFLGTFFLVLSVAITGNPLAIATILMAWVYIGGHVSGGHYNPILSFASALRGRLAWDRAGQYIAAQILGGIAAYAFVAFFFTQIVVPHPGLGVMWWQALIIEILLAFVFALVFLVVATGKKYGEQNIYGFVIGFTLLALSVLGTPISGGLFNPAIALGAPIVGLFKGMTVVWADVAVYLVGAFIGATLAAYAFRYFYGESEQIEVVWIRF